MKNIFRWIFGLGLALAVANYFISDFAALIDLIPSLFTLRRSYICLFSLILGCACKLSSVMMTLLGYAAPLSSNLAELFVSAIVDAIFSRIMAPITSYASTVIGCLKYCLRSNRDQKNVGQLPGGQTTPDQSSEGHMFFARELEIEHVENLKWWKWVKYPSEPRFKEAAQLKYVCWLEIKAKINFSKLSLSPGTNYAAYLIFQTTGNSQGLGTVQEAYVDVGKIQSMKEVCLKPTMDTPRDRPIGFPSKRDDGWEELELGQFYCDNAPGFNEVEVSIREIDDFQQKTGLIVAGMELRPI